MLAVHCFSVLALAQSAGPALLSLVTEDQLAPTSPAGTSSYGLALAIAGDTLVVGVGTPLSPEVCVYVDTGSTWALQATLSTPLGYQSLFGSSVAIDGDTLVAGANHDDVNGLAEAGSAYVYTRSGSSWVQADRLVAADAVAGAHFGSSAAVSGDRILVGAPEASGGGAVYEFERSEGGWTQVDRLAEPGLSLFGQDLDLDADQLIVSGQTGYSPPYAFDPAGVVFARGPQGWVSTNVLVADVQWDSGPWGASVALDGDTALVGAPHATVIYEQEGEVVVFRRGGTGWSEEERLHSGVLGPHFGKRVALVGDTAFASAPGEGAGTVRAFARGGTAWGGAHWTFQTIVHPQSSGQYINFGYALATDAGRLVVSAPNETVQGIQWVGTAYVQRIVPGAPISYCTAGVSAQGCTALLTATGVASATAPSGFLVSADQVEGSTAGLFYYSTEGRKAQPWGSSSSFQCIAPPVQRAGVLTSTGGAGACDGVFAQDFNAFWCPTCPGVAKSPGLGSVVRLQLWYRDPLSAGATKTALSDALEFYLGP